MSDSDNESYYSATSSLNRSNNNTDEKESDASSEVEVNSDSEQSQSESEPDSQAEDHASRVNFPDTGRQSPRTELQEGKTTASFIACPDKIFRTPFHFPSLAQFAYLTSPSSIWMRLPNNVTDKLELSTAVNLDKANLQKHKYVMAPVKSDVLGRARILDFNVYRTLAYVYFIDHGEAGAVAIDDLFALPKEFIHQPWQTIPLKLHGVHPNNITHWTFKEVESLKKVFSRFKYFWVEPVPVTVFPNDDGYHYPADIRGLTEEEYNYTVKYGAPHNSKGDQIAQLYFSSLKKRVVPFHRPVNGTDQKSYPFLNPKFFDELPIKPMEREYMLMERQPVMPFWANNEFPQLPTGFAEQFLFDGNKLWTFLMNPNIGAHPNRFFGYRLDILKKGTTSANDTNRYRRFTNEAVNLSNQLRNYYHNSANLHPMLFDDVLKALDKGINVYGIVEQPHEDLLCKFYFQRVKIISAFATDKDTSIFRVQMLDTGNIDHCVPSSVYRIHPSHLETYPLSYCFYYTSLEPSDLKKEWVSRQMKHFNVEVLKPMKVFVVELVVDDGKTPDLSQPLEISTMKRVSGAQAMTVEEQMIESRHAQERTDEKVFDLLADIRFPGETRAGKFAENLPKHGRFND